MQNLYPIRLSAFLLCAALFSCEKSDDEKDLVLSGEYQTQSSAEVSSAEMYTNKGQVTDARLIAKFLSKSYGMSYTYGDAFVLATRNEPLTGSFNFHFKSDQKVTITFPSSQAIPVEARIAEKTSKLVLLTALDSSLVSPSGTFYGPFIANINLYKPKGKCYPVAAATGFSSVCKVAQNFPIQQNNGKLSLPLFSYLLQVGSPSGSTGHTSVSNLFGIVDRSILNQLRVSDTLVIQSKLVGLQKL